MSGANGSCGSATSCQAAVGFDGPSGLGSPLGLGAFAPPEVPTITGFTPSSGITGASVTIEGAGLAAVTGVAFGSLAAKFTILSSSQIEAVVPDGASKGKITLTTPTASVTSTGRFSPTLSITSFSPQHGAPGTRVTIKGIGFNARSSVSFDGAEAHVDSAHAKRLRVIVPAKAGAGPISVTNTSGTLGTVYSAGSFTP